MNADLVYQLVETAIALARSEVDGSDTEELLSGIISAGVNAYHASVGKPVDPQAVGILSHI